MCCADLHKTIIGRCPCLHPAVGDRKSPTAYKSTAVGINYQSSKQSLVWQGKRDPERAFAGRGSTKRSSPHHRSRTRAAWAVGCECRWISVEERLPEDQRDILTVNGHGLIRIMGLYHKHGDKWSWVHDERIKHYNDITHWMPMPELPKKDDHEDNLHCLLWQQDTDPCCRIRYGTLS